MAKDPVKIQIVNENNNDADKHLDNEIEKIFGKASSPKAPSTGLLNSEMEHGRQYLNGNNTSENDTEHPSQPLLEPTRNKQAPPLAGPEIDDLDGDPPSDATPYLGIDDGLLETSSSKPDAPESENGEHDGEREPGDEHVLRTDDNEPTDGKVPWDETDYPYGDWPTTSLIHTHHPPYIEEATVKSHTSYVNGLGTRFGIDDRGISPLPGVIPDVNQYQQKKNLAQGMMDLALLSANANQLRYVLESTNSHPYYYSSLTFISLSIIIQVLVGVGLILNSRYDVNNQKEICKADKINNMTVLGIFLITIVNVFITSFSVANPAVVQAQAQLASPSLRVNST